MGRGVRRAHPRNVPDTEDPNGGPNKLSIDYMYLNDEDGNKDQLQMVMVDPNYGRLFAYIVPRKGVIGEAEWVPSRVMKDLDNMGYGNVTIQPRSDQEFAVVTVQGYIGMRRPTQTILINSPVGE